MQKTNTIARPKGKLGVLIVGLNGAVSTTFLAGVLGVRKGLAQAIGSLTQMGHIRLGKRTERRSPLIKEFLQLAKLDDLVFGGWDIRNEDCFASAVDAGVLHREDLENVKKELSTIRPMKAVFDQFYVKKLKGSHVKKGKTKWDLMEQIRDDIRSFKKRHKLDRSFSSGAAVRKFSSV